MLYLGWIASLGCLICLIIVLIKQFQNAGVVHGIIGIITCGIWTFIWGWMKHKEYGLTKVMTIWTIAIVVMIPVNVMNTAAIIRQAQSANTPAAQP